MCNVFKRRKEMCGSKVLLEEENSTKWFIKSRATSEKNQKL